MTKSSAKKKNDNIISPLEVATNLSQHWSPQVIAEVNDCYVKVAKLKGEFVWHSHEDEDEMFMILKGQLSIELEDTVVDLREGDVYVVKKGVRHNPIAKEECIVMLLEPKNTLHTGDVLDKKSKSIAEQLTYLDLDT
jgi:mannose-6-phosphate isomerase-like protein (cupin superfamily)